jgi:hypothetical protein
MFWHFDWTLIWKSGGEVNIFGHHPLSNSGYNMILQVRTKHCNFGIVFVNLKTLEKMKQLPSSKGGQINPRVWTLGSALFSFF